MRKLLKLAKSMLQTRNYSVHIPKLSFNVFKDYLIQLLALNTNYYRRKSCQPLVALQVFWTSLLPHIIALSCQDLFLSFKIPNMKLKLTKSLKPVASKTLDLFLLQSKINQRSVKMIQSLLLRCLFKL